MTATIARLVLAMLILPATGAVFVILFAAMLRPGGPPSPAGLLFLWAVVYAFVGSYWTLLWRSTVRWNGRRLLNTLGGTAVALASGVGMGVLCMALNDRIPPQVLIMFGGGIVPIVWVLLTVLAWRETPGERTMRLAAAGAADIVCPMCGYRMTGLREARCPECGGAFTLEQLVAAQPARTPAAAL
jgi:hypothetical protein